MVHLLGEDLVGDNLVGNIEVAVVSSAYVMVPAVRFLTLGGQSDVGTLSAIGVNFPPATLLGAIIMRISFHADLADIREFLIVGCLPES